MKSISERDYYTVAEVAEMLDVSHSTVWRWIRAGKLPAYRVGSRNLRIKRQDLQIIEQPEPGAPGWADLSLAERRKILLRPLSEEETREQKKLFDKVMITRKGRSIAPLTSDELVRQSRDRDFWYESRS